MGKAGEIEGWRGRMKRAPVYSLCNGRNYTTIYVYHLFMGPSFAARLTHKLLLHCIGGSYVLSLPLSLSSSREAFR